MPVMQTVYDKEGNPHTVEPVDAREYLRSGHYTSQCAEPSAKAEETEELKPAAIESGPVELVSGKVQDEPIPFKTRGKPGPKPKVKQEVQ